MTNETITQHRQGLPVGQRHLPRHVRQPGRQRQLDIGSSYKAFLKSQVEDEVRNDGVELAGRIVYLGGLDLTKLSSTVLSEHPPLALADVPRVRHLDHHRQRAEHLRHRGAQQLLDGPLLRRVRRGHPPPTTTTSTTC